MKAIKDHFDTEACTYLAQNYTAIHSTFPGKDFVQIATHDSEKREYRERVNHIGEVLFQMFNGNFVTFYEASFPLLQNWKNKGRSINEDFILETISSVIEHKGLRHAETALQLMEPLTEAFTAEFCIRPYLDTHHETALTFLEKWQISGNEHHRRLVSEGTRPNLPWGKKVQKNETHPFWTTEWIRPLANDNSEYVRRSVANHLNDLSKTNSDKTVKVIKTWKKNKDMSNPKNISHALRGLIKAGHPGALELVDVAPFKGTVSDVTLSSSKLKLNEKQQLLLKIKSNQPKEVNIILDFIVHLVRKNGKTNPKVFKGGKFSLKPQEKRNLSYDLPFRKVTTTQYYTGNHKIDVQVNGKVVGSAEFHLLCDE